jgi:hypothetical protein
MPTDEELKRRQFEDIARRTREAETADWHGSMRQAPSLMPWENLGGGPSKTDPRYAVQGLQENIAEQQRRQAASAMPPSGAGSARIGYGPISGSFQKGGLVPSTGDYGVHKDEQVLAAPRNATTAATAATAAAAQNKDDVLKKSRPVSTANPWLDQMAANVNAPLQRVQGFRHGGRIPATGVYRLHRGERVLPKGLAQRYRETKHG